MRGSVINRFLAAALMAVLVVAVQPGPAEAEEGFTPIPVIKGIEPLKVGSKAPAFSVKDLEGGAFDFSKELGKSSYLLIFWSIYCEPCREEMPLVQKLQSQYKGKGVEVITVNLDGDPFLDAVKGFMKQGKYTFKVLMDELEEENFKIADPYSVAGTPVAYLIDKKGIVTFYKVGRTTEEELKGAIEKVLATP
jgi:thiol-disulfide isomerase/thioredoxin